VTKIEYLVGGRILKMADAAIINGDDVAALLAEGVIDSIATAVDVTLGGRVVTLAMLLDPEHWAEDWEAVGVEDVDEFLLGPMEPADGE
jgi:hypothetical protein